MTLGIDRAIQDLHHLGTGGTAEARVPARPAVTGAPLEARHGPSRQDFIGDLTPGLPHEYGAQVYRGLEAMLTEGWGRVGQDFAMRPEPEEILVTDDYIIGRGNYVGTAVSTGKPVKARFAHFWRVEGDKIVSVVQVTDSATWQRALT